MADVNALEQSIRSGTWSEDDLKIIDEVVQRFELGSLALEAKFNAVCLMFNESCKENGKFKDELKNTIAQLEKQDQTKDALKNLVTALRTQVQLTKEEGELKLREETQRRIDNSKQFEATINELSTLISANSDHNKRLKEENESMASKLTVLLKEFEDRDKKNLNQLTELRLQIQLYDAQLAKAKIEKAEGNADFSRERLEFHKQLLESKQENEKLLEQTCEFKDQLDTYKKKYEALEKDVGSSSQTFSSFRSEMERLGTEMRKVERETRNWKEKFEASNDQVRKMNALSLQREQEVQGLQKKLAAMEKLNRTLLDKSKEGKKE